jgi:hypothetical protein
VPSNEKDGIGSTAFIMDALLYWKCVDPPSPPTPLPTGLHECASPNKCLALCLGTRQLGGGGGAAWNWLSGNNFDNQRPLYTGIRDGLEREGTYGKRSGEGEEMYRTQSGKSLAVMV